MINTKIKNFSNRIETEFSDNQHYQTFCGAADENLVIIEKILNLEILVRGNTIIFKGKSRNLEHLRNFLKQTLPRVEDGHPLGKQEIQNNFEPRENNSAEITSASRWNKSLTSLDYQGRKIFLKSSGQKSMISSIQKNAITFAIGPAGTGKTFLAVLAAVTALKNREVERIILVRPAVEAGEKLGFLPGDLQDKVDPYFRPLYDSLHDLLGVERTKRLIERGIIEIAPLAYMRGRTLNRSFVILDEAQNTTFPQMKMFLTRLGIYSKMVVNGDITQIDLEKGLKSGLIDLDKILAGIHDLEFVYLTQADVNRHPLVKNIIDAYNNFETEISETGETEKKSSHV